MGLTNSGTSVGSRPTARRLHRSFPLSRTATNELSQITRKACGPNKPAVEQAVATAEAEIGEGPGPAVLVTGSSDYHGLGKPNQPGENTTDDAMVARIIERATGNAPVYP